jgi:ATP-binding cassette subfamily B multidrug efflux pump
MKMAAPSLKEFRSIKSYLARYRGRYAVGFVFLGLVDAAQILIPQLVRRAIDLISTGDFELRSVLSLCLAMIGTAATISIGRFLWRYFIHGSSRRIETEMRDRLFSHLLLLSSGFYQKNKTGDLMARATNDLNAVRMSIGMGFVAFVDGTFMATAILVVMFVQDAHTAAPR